MSAEKLLKIMADILFSYLKVEDCRDKEGAKFEYGEK